MLLFSASYYLHSPSTASAARCSSGLLGQGLNLSTAWCTMRLSNVEKDWNHELKQKVVTLNICCNTACQTFQLPHITTGSFHSHRRQPTTGSFQSLKRLKERNKTSVRRKSFAVHKSVWSHFQVGWSSGLQIVFLWNNQKYVWIILLKMTFLNFQRYSGYIWQARWTLCKIFLSNFLRISHAKNH